MEVNHSEVQLYTQLDSKYSLRTALKFAAVPIVSLLFLAYMLWVFMSMTHVFFEANGYLEVAALREAFFDYLVSDLIEKLPFVGAYFCFLFVMGYYFSRLLLHPFKVTGIYCEKKIKDKNHIYVPGGPLIDLKLITNFSSVFFSFIDEVDKNGKFEKRNLDARYKNVQKPVLDKIYFLHFLILVFIITSLSAVGLYVLSVDLHGRIVELAIQTLSTPSKSLGHFLSAQKDILATVQWGAIALMFFMYTILSYFLIKQMSGVSYSYFTSMRKIMDGEPKARISIRDNNPGHLYAYYFNKYMDQVLGESEKKSSKLP